MKKKLKIKFWKPEKALAMQVVEQEDLLKLKEEGKVRIMGHPDLSSGCVYLRGEESSLDFEVIPKAFKSNQVRDEYISRITNAITDELFTGTGELKVGELCEVRVDEYCGWNNCKLLAILPDNYRSRFITQCDEDENNWFGYEYAQPINKRIEPKVETNGEVITYTWEEE